jgi:hypothetical protein
VSKTIASLQVLYPSTVLLHGAARTTPPTDALDPAADGAHHPGESSRSEHESDDTTLSARTLQHTQPTRGEPLPESEAPTGASLPLSSAHARRQVAKYAKLRNATCRQATRAYLCGEKALAHELSIKVGRNVCCCVVVCVCVQCAVCMYV